MARVQLSRLDGLAGEDCGRTMRASSAEINGLPGLTLRRANWRGDAESRSLRSPTMRRAPRRRSPPQRGRRARDEDLQPRDTRLHVYPFWAPVLAAIEADGRPAPAARARWRSWSGRSTWTSPRSARNRISTRSRSPRKGGQAGSRVRLRIGSSAAVVVAQAMHLHFLAHMNDRFELAAVRRPEPGRLEGATAALQDRGHLRDCRRAARCGKLERSPSALRPKPMRR